MLILVSAFIASLLFSLWAITYAQAFFPKSLDIDVTGIQKFHTVVVPRIGGIGIFLGVLLGLFVRYWQDPKIAAFGFLLIVGSLPVFCAGVVEDITKLVSARFRLMAAIISAALAGYLLNGWLTSLQLLGVDNLLVAFPVISVALTCFAVAGVSHSFNIIDGYNGLSAMVAVLILLGIGYVAFQLSDMQIMTASLVMIGALFGFLVWNYPRGLIFLGDGGAYLIGFWIAELSVLLTARHPEVSKWFPLLLCFYPIFETIFTIYRRVVIKRRSPGIPDATHLHQLIYSRVVRLLPKTLGETDQVSANSTTAPFLWLMATASIVPAVLFWKDRIALICFSFLFSISYIFLYWSIVRFSTPKWLTVLHRLLKSRMN